MMNTRIAFTPIRGIDASPATSLGACTAYAA